MWFMWNKRILTKCVYIYFFYRGYFLGRHDEEATRELGAEVGPDPGWWVDLERELLEALVLGDGEQRVGGDRGEPRVDVDQGILERLRVIVQAHLPFAGACKIKKKW